MIKLVAFDWNGTLLDDIDGGTMAESATRLHFGFKETNIEGKADRIYINTKNASTIGPDYKFVITFKNDRVFRRVIKGGPQNLVTQEKAFLLGPGGFIGDLLTGGVNKGINLIK